ncbi:hypothetical protein GE09DRAFT_1136713 [Coniochaeta sp. 2T2.1]|nr:hypothetical protein GE09DRAFT_1136713 [Coniochaeta sp. 2T2.1]
MSFPQFAEFPPEIRQMIWRLCRPARIIEMEIPEPGKAYPESGAAFHCEMSHTSRMNRNAPIITRVCHEARNIAEPPGRRTLIDRHNHSSFDFASCLQDFMEPPSWIDARQDIVLFREPDYPEHLDDSDVDSGGEAFQEGMRRWEEAVEVWRRLAENIRPQGVATMLYRSACLDMFKDQSRGPSDVTLLVCVKVVPLHASHRAALDSGLFGRLGDAPVVVIEADKREEVLPDQAFWQDHGSKPDDAPAEFFAEYCRRETWAEEAQEKLLVWALYRDWYHRHRGLGGDRRTRYAVMPGDNTPGELNWEHQWVKRALEDQPKMRPAIMFRLCMMECPSTRAVAGSK